MKIVLINPAWTDTLGSFAQLGRERTYSPPLGLCYLAAALEKNGHTVEIIDAEVERLCLKEVLLKVENIKPNIIGINIFSPTLHKSKEIAEKIKISLPHIPIVVGGAHVSIMKEQALLECYDYGIINEGEHTIVEFLKVIEGDKKPSEIRGLIYREKNKIVVNHVSEITQDINSLPFPAIHLLKKNLYQLKFVNGRKTIYTSIMAMRGCPFECVFCSEPLIGGRKVRFRSPENIADELESINRQLGISHFTFVDSNITLNRNQVIGICDQINKRKLSITWEGWTRANLIDEDLLKRMKESGFVRMSFGVESGDPEILKIIKKEVSLDSIKNAFRLCKKLKIEISCSAMLGLPGETRKSVNKTIEFIRNTPEILYSNFSIAIPYPGTELFDMAQKGKHGLNLIENDYTKWARYDNGPMSVNDLTPHDLVRLQKIGLLKIHLTPKRILASLKIIKPFTLFPIFIRLLFASLQDLKTFFNLSRKE
ncbi:MAG: radical SAM protein [Elusimicrobiota bacterium]